MAVVAGMVISATGAFAHDFSSNVLRGGKATEQEQMRVAKWASALAFAVAASADLPVFSSVCFGST